MNQLIQAYINDPVDAHTNFDMALHYHQLGQTASAVSFYLRAAERTTDTLLKYECLLKASQCFDSQGSRGLSVRGLLQHAMSLCPQRPEAYYLLSRYYERDAGSHPNTNPSVEEWFHGYTFASVGLEVCDHDAEPLRTDVGYPGKFALLFEKGVCAWWCGLCDESRDILLDLYHNWTLDELHRSVCRKNLSMLGIDYEHPVRAHWPWLDYYDPQAGDLLRYPFATQHRLERNYSEACQDLFVLSATQGKTQGTYLEIGCGDPTYGSNTYLLETKFGWTGTGIDCDPDSVQQHQRYRRNPALCADARTLDYHSVLAEISSNGVVDYLQLDCDPPETTYDILTKIPFDQWKFAVITYEHDHYVDPQQQYRDLSRDYLRAQGYVLVAPDIAPDAERNFEDWWVHPDLVSAELIDQLRIEPGSSATVAHSYVIDRLRDGAPSWFDWGDIANNQWFHQTLNREIFEDNIYQKFFQVEAGHTVVDVGASVGVFAYAASRAKPKRIICLEPHPQLFETLTKNSKHMHSNVVCVNSGVAAQSGRNTLPGLFDSEHTEMWGNPQQANTIAFDHLVQQQHIHQIDFLKCDCEGGEYDIFTEKNYQWIKSNVKLIAGEWHLHNTELKEKFRQFRDLYLANMPNFQVFSIDHVDIKWDIWNQHFIDYYAVINLYIDNRT